MWNTNNLNRIWARVTMIVSYSDNNYTTCACIYIWFIPLYVHVCVWERVYLTVLFMKQIYLCIKTLIITYREWIKVCVIADGRSTFCSKSILKKIHAYIYIYIYICTEALDWYNVTFQLQWFLSLYIYTYIYIATGNNGKTSRRSNTLRHTIFKTSKKFEHPTPGLFFKKSLAMNFLIWN